MVDGGGCLTQVKIRESVLDGSLAGYLLQDQINEYAFFLLFRPLGCPSDVFFTRIASVSYYVVCHSTIV